MPASCGLVLRTWTCRREKPQGMFNGREISFRKREQKNRPAKAKTKMKDNTHRPEQHTYTYTMADGGCY